MPQCVIAVRMDDARDFVVDPAALVKAPSVSTEFPNGCRVRVTEVAKCFPKSDEMAEKLLLGKWTSGLKPHEGTVGTVLASSPHPTDETITVVGIRSELDNRDFVMDSKGVCRAPNVSKEFPEGASVRVTTADKAYTKMDAAAKELTLSKWVAGTTPQDGEIATVLGSMQHPSDENLQVVGIRTSKGQDFVIATEGIEAVTLCESKKFPLGSRVYISNTDKLFPKMDDVAKRMNLSRWVMGVKPAVPQLPVVAADGTEESAAKKRKVGKPLMSCAGEVRGSAPHPNGEVTVIGVRTETGQEFLIAEEGLTAVPQEDPEFPVGTRIKIAEVGKIYPKWDDKAFDMALTRWVLGEKPTAVMTGKVVGSVAK